MLLALLLDVDRVADGPVRVELQRTLLTNVPGVAFGVRADAFSNEDDSPVKGEGRCSGNCCSLVVEDIAYMTHAQVLGGRDLMFT